MNTDELLRSLPLPEQYAGKEIIISHHRELPDDGPGSSFFDKVTARLKDVNNWHQIMGTQFSVFQLTDAEGKEVKGRAPEKGMHFRVDISGPGSGAGAGYDWVEIIQAEDFRKGNCSGSFITVHPCDNPLTDDTHTAHFYAATSTSTFLVYQCGKEAGAIILDKNIEINTDNRDLTDSIRNTVFGVAGITAFSKLQWNQLAAALIAD